MLVSVCCLIAFAGPVDSAFVRVLTAGGVYAEAEARQTARVAELEVTYGVDSMEALSASDLLVEALVLNGKAALASTVQRADATLNAKQKRLPADHSSLVPSLHNWGRVLAELRRDIEAIVQFHQAIALTELVGMRDRQPDILDDLGASLTQLARYDEAQQSLERALEVRQCGLSISIPDCAHTLELLGRLWQEKGEYSRSRPFLERALAIRRTAAEHPALAAVVDALGNQLWYEGDLVGALRLHEEALHLAELSLGPRHPTLIRYLSDMAEDLELLGDLAGVRRALGRAYEIAQASLGDQHPEIGWVHNALGNDSVSTGNYNAARDSYEKALAVFEGGLGRDHVDCATPLHNLALVAGYLGDLPRARDLQARALALWSRHRGPEHPYVGRALDALGLAHLSAGNLDEARSLFAQALVIRERALNPAHRDIAETLTNQAKTEALLGAGKEALSVARRAEGLWEKAGAAEDQPGFARTLMLLGDLESEAGLVGEARTHQERALDIRRRALGSDHPEVAESRAALGRVLAQAGDAGAAFSESLEAEAIGTAHLLLTARDLPEKQALEYAAVRPAGLDLALSLLAQRAELGPEATTRALNAVVRSRALILDEMAARLRTNATDSESARLAQLLAAARQRLANLTVRGPRQGEAGYLGLLEAARAARDDAERALAEHSVAFRDALVRARLGLDEIRSAIPPDGAILSFVRYRDGFVGKRPPAYLAFVIRGAGAPSVIPLGTAAELDEVVARWREEVVAPINASRPETERRYRVAADALRHSVWDPVASHLSGIRRLYVVPDGQLHLVSFAALPVDGRDYLVSKGPIIHYLGSERDLVLRSDPPGRGILAVGAPAFDQVVSTATSGKDVVFRGRRSACGSFATLRFEALPASSREVVEITSSWPRSEASILVGPAANEGAFKRAASGRRILHLATHGFVIGGDCGAQNAAESPLLRAGLAMAGANRRDALRSEDEDGILTAEEVAGLDLTGVEWAVLSACDTGLGDIRSGEGVLGLRRAFQMAGARTLVMSLWPVEDKATRGWMRALYNGRLRLGFDTARSVQEASVTILRERRRAGQSTHPAYWAGFVAAGDWR